MHPLRQRLESIVCIRGQRAQSWARAPGPGARGDALRAAARRANRPAQPPVTSRSDKSERGVGHDGGPDNIPAAEDLFVGLDWSLGQRAEGRRMLAAQADGLLRAHRAEQQTLQAHLTELRRAHAAEKKDWHRHNLELTRKLNELESGAATSQTAYPLHLILHDRFVDNICDGTFPEPPFYWPLSLKWRSLYLHDEPLRQRLSSHLRINDEVVFGERIVRAYDLMKRALQPSSGATAAAAAAGAEDRLEQEDLDLAEQVLLHFGIPDSIIRRGMCVLWDKAG